MKCGRVALGGHKSPDNFNEKKYNHFIIVVVVVVVVAAAGGVTSTWCHI